MSIINLLTYNQTITDAEGYKEIFEKGTVLCMFGIFCSTADMMVYAGANNGSPDDEHSVFVPAGVGFEINNGIAGSVHVSVSEDAVVHAYGA